MIECKAREEIYRDSGLDARLPHERDNIGVGILGWKLLASRLVMMCLGLWLIT